MLPAGTMTARRDASVAPLSCTGTPCMGWLPWRCSLTYHTSAAEERVCMAVQRRYWFVFAVCVHSNSTLFLCSRLHQNAPIRVKMVHTTLTPNGKIAGTGLGSLRFRRKVSLAQSAAPRCRADAPLLRGYLPHDPDVWKAGHDPDLVLAS
jgi:hypothetical protein